MVATNEEKAEVLKVFALVFNENYLPTSWVDGQSDRDWGSKVYTTVSKNQVYDLWKNLNM